MQPCSLIVADPNTLMLQALAELFERDRRFTLVATSKTAEGFLETCLRVPVDIGIVEWTIPQLGAERRESSSMPHPTMGKCRVGRWLPGRPDSAIATFRRISCWTWLRRWPRGEWCFPMSTFGA